MRRPNSLDDAAELLLNLRPTFADAGGNLLSIPVAWFNNGPWKDQFTRPGTTFVTVIVEKSHAAKQRHECCILGAASNDNFDVNHEIYTEGRARWIAHGERHLPSYEFGDKHKSHMPEDEFDFTNDLNGAQEKKKGTLFVWIVIKSRKHTNILTIEHPHTECAVHPKHSKHCLESKFT
jgi:hypothetical protein